MCKTANKILGNGECQQMQKGTSSQLKCGTTESPLSIPVEDIQVTWNAELNSTSFVLFPETTMKIPNTELLSFLCPVQDSSNKVTCSRPGNDIPEPTLETSNSQTSNSPFLHTQLSECPDLSQEYTTQNSSNTKKRLDILRFCILQLPECSHYSVYLID